MAALLFHLFVAKPASRGEPRCHDWEALKRGLQEGEEIAYEFNGRALHVWTGRPERGDPCECGARAWA